MTELLKNYESEIERITLKPSDGGRFEVQVNGRLIYSKLQTHRHVEPGEIATLVGNFLRENHDDRETKR
jgi:selenoprotein W-related protein